MNTLDQLSIGEKIKVKSIEKDSAVKRKLLDMGITPGVELKVTGKAPFGDPLEILVRGYKLTLRKDEAKVISGE
ncbi:MULTISPECIES: FeoA family protein [Clostridium]|uniref:Ferrous iron transport protein A n=1 Tax=Clostridium senegalense TaxID=1465809 RepID=A0A6M0H760_9CLOT|nr:MULTISPECIES: ferrous iron transport protein A [Clostridium]MBU5227072.1 ferrous iron transport protein A [Clostridium senegalense]NEU06377.1 ferrous iron transport protein A [Clostridium senegalense]